MPTRTEAEIRPVDMPEVEINTQPEALSDKAHANEQFHLCASDEFNYKLLSLIRSRHPLIFVSTKEEDRLLVHLRNMAAASDYVAFCWDCVGGMSSLHPATALSDKNKEGKPDPITLLNTVIGQVKKIRSTNYKTHKGIIYVMLDFYKYFNPRINQDPRIERLLRKLAHEAKGGTLIFVGPDYAGPDALGHIFEAVEFPLPNTHEISSLLDRVCDNSGIKSVFGDLQKTITDKRDDLINAVRGLTLHEAHAAYMKTLTIAEDVGKEPFDMPSLLAEKRSALSKSNALQYVEPGVTLDQVGGLGNLTGWVRDRRLAFSLEAQEYGLPTPRGMLLAGVPGGGKSHAAKGTASEFAQPLIRLDIGAAMGSLVGQSEAQTREAIRLAETLAPCVTGSTEIIDAAGQVYTVRELIENKKLFSAGAMFIYAFNEETKNLEKTQVNAVIKQPKKKPILEIVTANSVLQVTPDHKMMVIRDGQLEWLEAGRLELNDYLVTPKKLIRDTVDFNILDPFLDNLEQFEVTDERITDITTGHFVNLPDSGFVPQSAAYIAGMIDASGFLEDDTLTAFDADVWKVTHTHCLSMASCFGVEPEIVESSCYSHNSVVYRMIDFIRENLTRYNDQMVESYLAGFFEASNQIQLGKNTKVSFIVDASDDEQERLCRALHCIGIPAPKRTMRTVYISSSHEIDTLAKAIIPKITDNNLCVLLSQAVGDCTRSSNHIGYRALDSNDAVSPEDINKGYNDSEILQLVQSDIVGVKVYSIESRGKDWVYDLFCAENHNFFGNNLLCHNCVLWVDEVDKALAAATSQGSSDGGTTKRVISTFLTWLQEKTAPVFVICTANNVDDIPPEFMRAGRFDEVFFIDLPSNEGKESILRILLSIEGFNPDDMEDDKWTISAVAHDKNLKDFSGAEIKKAIHDAMFHGFKESRRITLNDIVESASHFEPLAKTRSEDFKRMRKWAEGNTRKAND